MQPEGPYRFTHVLGGSPVGKAWMAIDGQGGFVTVAVLDATVAAAPGWREAFAGIANSLAQAPDGAPFTHADFSATAPWVAYPGEAGSGAEKLFRALGVEYQPVPTAVAPPASAPPQPVSGPPQPVSGPPQPVSGMPHAPWAVHANPIPGQPVSAAPHPVSAAPAPAWDAPTSATATQPVADPSPQSAAPVNPAEGVPAYDPFSPPGRRIRPSEPPRRPTGLRVSVAALALGVALGAGVIVWAPWEGDATPGGVTPTAFSAPPATTGMNPGIRPWGQAAPFSPEERALAIAGPSLVFVESVFTGVLRDTASTAPLSETPITVKRRCSGFVVNADGHVLTHGRCVRPEPETTRETALYTLGRSLVAQKKLAPAALGQYVRTKMATASFTGSQPGSEPTAEVFGQFNVARDELPASAAVRGEVLRVLPHDDGNLALVKLDQSNVPAVELNTGAAPQPGTSLLVLGYRAADAGSGNSMYTVASKRVQVTGTANHGTVPVFLVSDDVGIHSHGGIAIDASGRVVGVLGNDRTEKGGANRALVPVPVVTAFLAEAGVANALAGPDREYRGGLDAFFAGRNSEAVDRLDAVTKASPINLLAQSYRQNAVNRTLLKGEPDGSSRLPTALLAGLAGALVVGLVVAVVVRRRRSRP